jgi:predicted short-subunit dehydrogenase-like oxidoreductase (DUF2520 family)
MKPVTIIGAGAVGRSIALALFYSGVKIHGVYSLSGTSAVQIGKRVKALHCGMLSASSEIGSIVLLCIPDAKIKETATMLARILPSLHTGVVIHTSGARSSAELVPLKGKRCSLGSFHPMQTFPHKKITSFNGVWCAIEGDKAALAVCRQLARKLHAHAFVISKEVKVLYHIAGVFASNYVVTLMSVIQDLAVQSGIPEKNIWKIFRPIIEQAVRNTVQRSPAEALTGPIIRGDTETIVQHLTALSSGAAAHLAPLYSALGIEAVRLAKKQRR